MPSARDPGKACGRARSRRCLFSWRIPKKRIYAEGACLVGGSRRSVYTLKVPGRLIPGRNRPPAPFKGGAAARTPHAKTPCWSVGAGCNFAGVGDNAAGGALPGKLGHPSFPKSTTTGRETQLAARYGRFEARALLGDWEEGKHPATAPLAASFRGNGNLSGGWVHYWTATPRAS